MQIFIPSLGRHDRQTTVQNLPREVRERITVVTPFGDSQHYHRELTGSGVKIASPPLVRGIGHARQWCIDQCESKCLMLDDDLVFATRRADEPTKFKDATDAELLSLIAEVENTLDEFAHVGVATREGGNRDTNMYAHNTRLLRALAYRTDIMREEDIRFDSITVMEDFHVSLSLLQRGYESRKINWMVQNQNGSNLDGGCSIYRTAGVQAEAAHTLAERHPGIVKVVQKETKTAWGGGTRTDVRIGWKKALNTAPETKNVQAPG